MTGRRALNTLARIPPLVRRRVAMIDFGLVDAVDAESIGPPGKRTFRIRVRAGSNTASLWMEKEQLNTLGQAFSQILAARSQQRGQPAEAAPVVGGFTDAPDVDFRIARMGLDFDDDQGHIVLLADDAEALERGETPAFRMELTRSMALELIEHIPPIVAAGRPLCPLCGQPTEADGKHFCPGSNGHSTQPIPDPTPDDHDDR